MDTKILLKMFSVVSIIMVLWGVVFAFFGLGILPIVSKGVLIQWESSLYGAIMIGWGITLFSVGRIAFRNKDKQIMKIILIGLATWLIIEAIFSAYDGVWFNVGVDIAVLILFSTPLVLSIRSLKK